MTIRTMIRMKSNENDTARRTMAQVGNEAPSWSALPVRSKEKNKHHILGMLAPVWGVTPRFCHTVR